MDPTNEALLRRFEQEYMEMHSLTERHRKEHRRVLAQLSEHSGKTLDRITRQDVTVFIGGKLKSGLHPNSGRSYLSLIKVWTRWAASVGIVPSLVSAELESIPNPRGWTASNVPKPYKMEEIHALKAALSARYPVLPTRGIGSQLLRRYVDGRLPAMRRGLWRHAKRLQYEAQIALALELGLRRTEIFHLKIAQMHYDNEYVVVKTAKQGPASEKLRSVIFTSHARICVQEWLDFRTLITPPHTHPWLSLVPVADRSAQLQPLGWRTFGESLDVFGTGWRWHRLRHTCATEWLRAGVPLEKVSMYLGHASINQTLVYTEILKSDLTTAFANSEASFAERLGTA